jgi:hypothetical protein
MAWWDVDQAALGLWSEETTASGCCGRGWEGRIVQVVFGSRVGEDDGLFAGFGLLFPQEEATLLRAGFLAGID